MRHRLNYPLIVLASLLTAGCAGPATSGDSQAVPSETPPSALPAADTPAAEATTGDGTASATELETPLPGEQAAAAAADTARSEPDSRAARGHPATRPAPGWPVEGPAPLPGAILPQRRIVAFYGNPLSTRMGILGEIPPDQMLTRLDEKVAKWRAADPATPVVPALHLVAIVAQGSPMRDGKYRLKMPDSVIERVAAWAESRNALLFLDVQVGLSTVQQEIPRLAEFLKRPNVHLGVDPEFSMKDGTPPGRRVGTVDASDINWVVQYLSSLTREHSLPPKVLVVHRFTQRMVTNYDRIRLDPHVQIVMHMDGFGAPWLKRDTYHAYVQREPVQYTGFKVFFHNDSKSGHPIMSPADILELFPQPVYIQYQ